jgi:hypothetical protein
VPCQFDLRDAGTLTRREREGLAWLAERGNWTEVSVMRKSPREFDLRIEGYMTNQFDKKPIAEQSYRFAAWFVMAAVAEFWGMGKIENPTGDWSFLRDREPEVQWADFEAVLTGGKPTGQIAGVGAVVLLEATESLIRPTLH